MSDSSSVGSDDVSGDGAEEVNLPAPYDDYSIDEMATMPSVAQAGRESIGSSLGGTREEVDLAKKLAEIELFSFPVEENPEEDITGRMAYLDAAKHFAKRTLSGLATSNVVNQMSKSTWCLDYIGLGDRGAAALAAALAINTTVTTLSLVGNYISPAGAAEIVKHLSELPNLSSVDLSENKLGAPGPSKDVSGGAVISELLGRGARVQTLRLQRNALGSADVVAFADSLVENNSLQHLDLGYNDIGYRGAVALAHAIASNGDLLEVNLEWNPFLSTGCLTLLSEGFLLNNTIKRFNLSWAGLDDDCAELIGRIISENAIEEIIVAHNRITSIGADAIAKGLRGTSSLVRLVLDDNPLADVGCCAIMQSLEVATTVKEISLLQTGGGGATSEMRRRMRTLNPNVAITLTEDMGRLQGPSYV